MRLALLTLLVLGCAPELGSVPDNEDVVLKEDSPLTDAYTEQDYAESQLIGRYLAS